MNQARRVLAALVLLGLLATFGTATFGLPDAAGSPGYFDARDGDDALWLLIEGLSALLLPGIATVVMLGSRAGPPRAAPSVHSLAAPLAARLRAPPLL